MSVIGILSLLGLLCTPASLFAAAKSNVSTTTQVPLEPTRALNPVICQADLSPPPFWRKKPSVLEEMKTEKRIVSSAKTEKMEASYLYQMAIVAAGFVNVPIDETWTIVRNYEQLPQVDERFQEVKYDAQKQRLFLHAATLGYHARMTLQLNYCETTRAKEIHFESVDGSFKGMKGTIRFEDDRRQKTEISMTSDYRSESLPLPPVLMGVGLEVVASRVASSMRTYIEDLHRKKTGSLISLPQPASEAK